MVTCKKSKRTTMQRTAATCSQGTFILERLLTRFDIKGKRTSIAMKTLNGEVTKNCQWLVDWK